MNFKVPLVHASNVEIEKSELEDVLAVAKDSRENLSVTVNRLLDAIYSKTFLGSHSLSGGLPKTKKKCIPIKIRLSSQVFLKMTWLISFVCIDYILIVQWRVLLNMVLIYFSVC